MSLDRRRFLQLTALGIISVAEPGCDPWDDLSRETVLKSGTLYPILMRLTENSWLETRWEEAEPGRPPRHMYRLTTSGLQQARRFVAEAKARGFAPQLAPEGSRA